jgi:Large polyvalent protein-associated domain 7
MLGRVSSGADGIREYLETGRKKGREYDRDLVDDRIPLAGDIDLMEDTINQIQTKQKGDSRYLHITLSFAERFTESSHPGDGQINLKTIRALTEQYRRDLMAAYESEEYVFYAEAHIPKVTHDIHATTGEAYERLPHVHIVIPMCNIATGQYLNPLGHGDFNIQYHDAIQEKINHDFQLKSPYDFRRTQPVSSPLGRHKPGHDRMTAKELRTFILHEAVEAGAKTLEDIARIAEAYGDVRVRHGRDGDYLNVKPEWADKGINLKDITPQSLRAVADGVATAPSLRPLAAQIEAKVEHWVQRRALEVRHVSSKGRRAAYKELNEEGKAQWLVEKQRNSRVALLRTLNRGLYEHRGRINSEDGIVEHDAGNDDRAKSHHHPRTKSYYTGPTKGAGHDPQLGRAIAADERTVSADQWRNRRDPAEPGITTKESSYGRPRRDRYKPRLAKVGTFPPPDRIHRLRNLSELGMVRLEGPSSMLLPGHVSGDVGQPAAANADGMRWGGNRTVAAGAVEGVDLVPTPIGRALQTMRAREATCRTTLAQSATTLARNRAVALDIEPAHLALGRLRTVLERETLRACDPQKNLSRQKSVIAAEIRQAPEPVSDKRLKADTSPVHVIEAATRYYRINPEDYTTGVGRDGTPRIFHGGKQYNLGDFFTKHLGKTWDEAKPILTECYQASLSDALPQPDLAMWVAFNEWRSQSSTHRQNERENAREQLRDETLAVRALYKAQKEAAQKLKGAERRGAMAEARAARVIAMKEIAQSRQNVYETLKSPGRNAEYRTFLNHLAERGDLAALGELRRIQRAQPETGGPDFVHGQQADKPVFALPNYRVDIAGNVIYQNQGKAIIKDAKRGVEVLNTEQRTYDLALKVAVSRYGKSLTLSGDETFKQQMVEAARRSGLDLVFKDGRNPLAAPIRVNGPSRGR